MKRYLFTAIIMLLYSIAFADDEQILATTSSAAVSHSGSKIVFVSNSFSTDDLWVANRDGTNPTIITPWSQSIEDSPDWSPDDTKIVFSSTKDSSDANIWIINSNGTGPIQLTINSKDNKQPRFSPDGSKILFVSNRTGKNELWIMNSDGSNQRSIALIPLKISDPAWSPDGNFIVYVGTTKTSSNLFIINVNGTSSKQLTTGNFEDWNPDWGVQGIIFASNRGGFQGIWIIQSDGTNLHSITSSEEYGDLYPRWDYSSGSVFFTRSGSSADNYVSNIFTVDSSNNTKPVTNIKGFILDGDINADGKIDCADISIVKSSFGKKRGQIGYDSRADVNNDGIVDIRDLSLILKKLPTGLTCK